MLFLRSLELRSLSLSFQDPLLLLDEVQVRVAEPLGRLGEGQRGHGHGEQQRPQPAWQRGRRCRKSRTIDR